MSGEIIKNTVQNIKGKNSFCNTGSRSFLSYFVFKKWMNSRKELEMICEKPNLEFTKMLLEKNYQKFKMEYGASKLSNHMSHGLVSLCFLGASKMKLQDFYEKYSKKLEVLPNKLGVSITKENFKDYIGNSESYPDLLQFFTKQIEEEGKKKVIERYLPFISSGMIGAAFHGVIQLGFVLEKEIGDDVQISTGLAYCVTAHNNNLGKLSKTNQKEIPSIDIVVNILKDLGSQKDLLELVHYKDMGFRKRLDIVQHNSSAIEKISKYDIDVKDTPENIQKMMDTIIQVAYMIGVNNFFIIHLVTSMRAIKNIFNFVNKNSIDGEFSLLNNFWRSALLAYVSIGCPPPQVDRAFELKEYDWESVIKDVLRRDTEVHILKLIYVAKEENEESKIRKNGLGEEFYFNFAKNCSKITDWIFYE